MFFKLVVAIWANDVPYPPLSLAPTVTLIYPQVEFVLGVRRVLTDKV